MKKQLLAILLFVNSCVFAQNNPKLEEQVKEQIAKIQSLIRLSKVRVAVSSDYTPNFNSEDDFFFEDTKLDANQNLNDELTDFFSSNFVRYSPIFPYSLITFDEKKDEKYLLQKLLGKEKTYFLDNWDKCPVFQPISVEYVDGTWEDVKDKVITISKVKDKYTKKVKEDGEEIEMVDVARASKIEQYLWDGYPFTFKQETVLERSKLIKKINYQVQIPIEETKILYASKSGEAIETPFGIIELTEISGNKIQFKIPSVMKEKVVVKALYKDGRVLEFKNSNNFTLFSDEKIKAYEDYIKVLEQAQELVKSNAINSEKKLDKYIAENAPKSLKNADEKNSVTLVNMGFSGPIDKLAFIIPVSDSQIKTFYGAADLVYSADEKDYMVAKDFETGNKGILGKSGNWLVRPKFDGYFRMMNRYYFTDQIDDRDNTYHFNPKTNLIRKIDYKLYEYDIYLDKYVKIEPHVNGLKGLAEAETEKIVLPMEYSFLNLEDEKFWHLKKDGKEGVLGLDFKVIMPITYEGIDIDGGYFFVKNNKRNRIDAYNENGKNLTNGKFDKIIGTFGNGLLLVATEKEDLQSHYYYINDLCEIKIDAKNYYSPREFSGGMAVVKNKDGAYGYIDTNGALAIPFRYKFASNFFPTSQLALVKLKEGGNVLIDHQGKIVKKLPGYFDKIKLRKEERESRILMEGNKSFNEYGEEVEFKPQDYWILLN